MSNNNNNEIDIASAMNQPKKYQIDGESVEGHTIDELIKADQYLAKKKAAKTKLRGLKCFTISTQGPGE